MGLGSLLRIEGACEVSRMPDSILAERVKFGGAPGSGEACAIARMAAVNLLGEKSWGCIQSGQRMGLHVSVNGFSTPYEERQMTRKLWFVSVLLVALVALGAGTASAQN